MEPIAPLSWEDLPAGVLEIVFSKIDSQEELGPFRLVNSSWRNALDGSLKFLTIQKTHCGVDIEPLGRRFTSLEKLTIRSKDEDILHKLSSVKSLTKLHLHWVSRDSSLLRSNGVELLTNLSKLKISAQSNDFKPNFMEMLRTLPNLKHLCICVPWLATHRSPQQQSIEQLAGMTNLTRLDLHSYDLASFEFLSGLTNLEALLLINWFKARNVNVSPLSSLVHLTRLDLRGYGIGTSVVNLFANLKNLTWLGLANTVLKNGNLATLIGLSKLTHLDLSLNEVNDEGVHFLTGLVSLKRLILNDTRAKSAIQILAPLTGLEALHLDYTPTKGTDLMGLSNLVGLKEVSVENGETERGELERVSAALPHIKFNT